MANNSTGTPPGVPHRFDEAVERLDGDAGLLQEMAEMTAPEFQNLIRQSKSAVSEGECDKAVRSLHKLKGMLSTFESDGVVLEIQDVIEAGRCNNPGVMQHQMSKIEASIDNLVGDIVAFASR